MRSNQENKKSQQIDKQRVADGVQGEKREELKQMVLGVDGSMINEIARLVGNRKYLICLRNAIDQQLAISTGKQQRQVIVSNGDLDSEY